MEPIHLQLDIAIIGGGIAGLWLANRLKHEGYRFALFEEKALGGEQTMASQGMIHGGMKYTLNGALNDASETLADMPKHWRACLCGEGDVDLRHTRLLSDHFYLWSGNSASSKFTSFIASKAIHGRVDTVPDERRPPLLRHIEFGGNLYRLDDIVVDVPSLVTNLAHNIEAQCVQIDWSAARWQIENKTLTLVFTSNAQTYHLSAQQFVFCAGQGNAQLLEQLALQRPAMQKRPLQQVMVKHSYPYSFFGHCIGTETTPRLTISSHKLNPTEQIWYLGGSLAEKGVDMTPEELITFAKAELQELLPWVDLSDAQWQTLAITRAEPLQAKGLRPDDAFAETAPELNNLIVTWPTKLTLAPNLANKVIAILKKTQITPKASPEANILLRQILAHPTLAKTPWEIAFPPERSIEEDLALRFPMPNEEDE